MIVLTAIQDAVGLQCSAVSKPRNLGGAHKTAPMPFSNQVGAESQAAKLSRLVSVIFVRVALTVCVFSALRETILRPAKQMISS